jgi:hypothetical protein
MDVDAARAAAERLGAERGAQRQAHPPLFAVCVTVDLQAARPVDEIALFCGDDDAVLPLPLDFEVWLAERASHVPIAGDVPINDNTLHGEAMRGEWRLHDGACVHRSRAPLADDALPADATAHVPDVTCKRLRLPKAHAARFVQLRLNAPQLAWRGCRDYRLRQLQVIGPVAAADEKKRGLLR